MFKIRARHLVLFALVIVFFTSFRGARYILSNRLQELGLLLALLLFFYSAILAAINDRRPHLDWSKWVFVTLGIILYVMMVPAFLWANHTGAPMLPSVLAAREILIILICPTLYFLYRIGLTPEEIENSLYTALILIVISYIVFRFTLPIESWWTSTNPHVKSLVVWDPVRGYRLKMPTEAVFLTLIIAPIQIFRTKDLLARFIWVIAFGCAVLGIILMQGRSLTASILFGVLAYHAFFARKGRLALLIVVIPGALFAMAGIIDFFFKQLEEMYLQGKEIRFHSYSIAFENIRKYPLLGIGMNSKVSISEQIMFGEKFDSTDIGIVGITFKYGIIGAVSYVFAVIWLNVRAITANWHYRAMHGFSSALFIALTIKVSMDFLNILLSVTYTVITGMVTASIVIAMSAIYRQEYDEHQSRLRFT